MGEFSVTPIFIFNWKQRTYADYVFKLFKDKRIPARICEVTREDFLDYVDECVQDGMRYAIILKPNHEAELKVSFRALNLDGESPGVADIPAQVAVDYIIHQAAKAAGWSAGTASVTGKRKWEEPQAGVQGPAAGTPAPTQQLLSVLQQLMDTLKSQPSALAAQAPAPAPSTAHMQVATVAQDTAAAVRASMQPYNSTQGLTAAAAGSPAVPAVYAQYLPALAGYSGMGSSTNPVQFTTPTVQGGAGGLQAMLQSALVRQQVNTTSTVPQVQVPQTAAPTSQPKPPSSGAAFNLASILSKLKK